jgi:hypothetical protein
MFKAKSFKSSFKWIQWLKERFENFKGKAFNCQRKFKFRAKRIQNPHKTPFSSLKFLLPDHPRLVLFEDEFCCLRSTECNRSPSRETPLLRATEAKRRDVHDFPKNKKVGKIDLGFNIWCAPVIGIDNQI